MSSKDLFLIVEGKVIVDGSVVVGMAVGVIGCDSSGFFGGTASKTGLGKAGRAVVKVGCGVVGLVENKTSGVVVVVGNRRAALILVGGKFSVKAGAAVVVEGGGTAGVGRENPVVGADGCACCPKRLEVEGRLGKATAVGCMEG